LEIFKHWVLWQGDRDVFSFLKFYQNLVAQEICRSDEFISINKRINSLLCRYLTPNCDVLFAALSGEKFLQKFLIQCDLKGAKVSISKFLSSLRNIFGEQLLPEHLLNGLACAFNPYDQTDCANFETLAKIAEEVFKIQELPKISEGQGRNVSVVSSRIASCNECDLCVCSFTEWQNFNRFTEYVLSKKNCIITCTASCYDDVPDLLKQKIFSCTGKIFASENFQVKKHCSGSYAYNNLNSNILQTKIAYDSRNNARTKFNEYSHVLDLENAHVIPCKAVEILLKNPANAFYDHVLKLESVQSWFDVEINKKIFLGSLVHELLDVGEHCCAMPTLGQFFASIDKKWETFWKELAGAYSSAGMHIGHFALESIRFAKCVAYKFAAQIISLGYKYIATEVEVPHSAALGENFGDFKLTGRVDCILANENFATGRHGSINIFDFKTGGYDVLNPEKLSAQLAEYTGVQVCMYGLAYGSIRGFDSVNVQILKHDCESIFPININTLLGEGGAILAELARIFQSGIIGEKPAKFASSLANLPIATSTPPNNVVEEKLKIT
jgi:hypothetical protein